MKPEEVIFCLKHMLHDDINYTCAKCPLYEGHEVDIDCPYHKIVIEFSIRAMLAWKEGIV